VGLVQHHGRGSQILRLQSRFELVNVPFERFEIELPIPSSASRLGVRVERVD
jgi:hypothetical protein